MKKLYKVTIELMVIADDEDEAKYAASCVDVDACDVEIEEATECLPGWEDALPVWCLDDEISDVTCGELIKLL